MENFINYILKLYKEKKQIVLLSYFFAAVAAICFVIAGFCALVDQSFGISLLIVPIVALTALCANITVWALIKLFVAHIEEARSAKKCEASNKEVAKKEDDKKVATKKKA